MYRLAIGLMELNSISTALDELKCPSHMLLNCVSMNILVVICGILLRYCQFFFPIVVRMLVWIIFCVMSISLNTARIQRLKVNSVSRIKVFAIVTMRCVLVSCYQLRLYIVVRVCDKCRSILCSRDYHKLRYIHWLCRQSCNVDEKCLSR